jgi:hypothetical protein
MRRTGAISQIDLSSGVPTLLLDGVPVPLDKIKQLKTKDSLNS